MRRLAATGRRSTLFLLLLAALVGCESSASLDAKAAKEAEQYYRAHATELSALAADLREEKGLVSIGFTAKGLFPRPPRVLSPEREAYYFATYGNLDLHIVSVKATGEVRVERSGSGMTGHDFEDGVSNFPSPPATMSVREGRHDLVIYTPLEAPHWYLYHRCGVD